MATRSIVPRATGEGGIGTALKKWALGWINALVVATLNGITFTSGANTFNATVGTASLDVAAGAAVNIDDDVTIPYAFDYDEYTAASTACTGALNTAVVWKVAKAGRIVVLTLPITTKISPSAAASFTYGVVLPAKYRPTDQLILLSANIADNDVSLATPGPIVIGTDGVITVYKSTDLTNFTAAGNGGLRAGVGSSWIV